MSNPAPHAARDARILADLQDAVGRMHVIPGEPRVVFAKGTRTEGARPMAWQVLFERMFGPDAPRMRYRGTSAADLGAVIAAGFDSEPGLELDSWSHLRLADAMAQGPVIQAFRADRLPDDVSRALVGLLVFEEEGLRVDDVRTLVERWGRP
ncbi:MAG: hypothetical protein V4617_08305 [Gemmatimonadota bacterium]